MSASKFVRTALFSAVIAAAGLTGLPAMNAQAAIFPGSEQQQLPDFVKLVEENGPGVVNIQMIRNARTVEGHGFLRHGSARRGNLPSFRHSV